MFIGYQLQSVFGFMCPLSNYYKEISIWVDFHKRVPETVAYRISWVDSYEKYKPLSFSPDPSSYRILQGEHSKVNDIGNAWYVGIDKRLFGDIARESLSWYHMFTIFSGI